MEALVELLSIISSDVKANNVGLAKAYFDATIRAVISYRINHYVCNNISTGLSRILHNNDRKKYNVDIYPSAIIGEGFRIAHLGSIVIGDKVIIGKNCTIQSCVTIGQKDRNSGFPILGDNVYVGSGAKILGGVHVGSNSVIGANAVVIHDVEDNATVVGMPARSVLKQ